MCPPSAYSVEAGEFSITGADGKAVARDDRSDHCCDAPYPETVPDSVNIIVTFVVPLPGTGKYTLRYADATLTAAGTAAASLPFTA